MKKQLQLLLSLVVLLLVHGAERAHAQNSESVRLQSSWGSFRTAAADLLGWNVGLPANAFPQLTFTESAVKADALGLAFIEGSSTQRTSPEITAKLDGDLSANDIAAVKRKLRAVNVKMPVYRAETVGPDADSLRKLFTFAKAMGIDTVTVPANAASPADLEKLADEFGVNVALRSVKPADAAKLLEGRGKRVGLSADTGAWVQDGVAELGNAFRVASTFALVKDRLLTLNLSQRGAAGIEELLRQMYQSGLKPLFLTVSGTGTGDTFADLSKSLEGFEKALQPVMTVRVQEFSKSPAGQIRGPDRLTQEVRDQIAAALPKEAPAKPKKARKLLVLDINIGWTGHATIPHGNYAIEMMGKNTGAYEATFSNDLNNLKYPAIKQYDAVFLNSTVGQVFVDPEVRAGMLRFVREGGGLGGIHGASFTSMDWPDFMEMLGAGEGPHRVETATVKIDDPNSPLTKAFEGKEFEYNDEFYRFYANGPFSREKLHVLLSVDMEKSANFTSRAPYTRPDKDYALSWIHNYGQGRVFFCALGHTPILFETPALAAHVLAGIQFVLGDLDADATPSAKLKKP